MQTDGEFLCELAEKVQDNLLGYPYYCCDYVMSDIYDCVFGRCGNFRDFIRPYIENNKEKILANNLYDFSKEFKAWFFGPRGPEKYNIPEFSSKARIFVEADLRIPIFIQKFIINYNQAISDTEKSNYALAKNLLEKAGNRLAKISDVGAVYGFLNTMKRLDDAAIEAGVARDHAQSIALMAAKALCHAFTNEKEIAGAASYLPTSAQQDFIRDITALVNARTTKKPRTTKHSPKMFTPDANGGNDDHRLVKAHQRVHRHP